MLASIPIPLPLPFPSDGTVPGGAHVPLGRPHA